MKGKRNERRPKQEETLAGDEDSLVSEGAAEATSVKSELLEQRIKQEKEDHQSSTDQSEAGGEAMQTEEPLVHGLKAAWDPLDPSVMVIRFLEDEDSDSS